MTEQEIQKNIIELAERVEAAEMNYKYQGMMNTGGSIEERVRQKKYYCEAQRQYFKLSRELVKKLWCNEY